MVTLYIYIYRKNEKHHWICLAKDFLSIWRDDAALNPPYMTASFHNTHCSSHPTNKCLLSKVLLLDFYVLKLRRCVECRTTDWLAQRDASNSLSLLKTTPWWWDIKYNHKVSLLLCIGSPNSSVCIVLWILSRQRCNWNASFLRVSKHKSCSVLWNKLMQLFLFNVNST